MVHPQFYVRVTVDEARGLVSPKGSRCNPYAKFYWIGSKCKTSVLNNDTTPRWNKAFVIPVYEHASKVLTVELWSHSSVLNNPLGQASIDLERMNPHRISDGWYPLTPLEGCASGEVRLQIEIDQKGKYAAESSIAMPLELNRECPTQLNDVFYEEEFQSDSSSSFSDSSSTSPLTRKRDAYPAKHNEVYNKDHLIPARQKKVLAEVSHVEIQKKKLVPFWELKALFPQLPDKKIHHVLNANDGDFSQAQNVLMRDLMDLAASIRPDDFSSANDFEPQVRNPKKPDSGEKDERRQGRKKERQGYEVKVAAAKKELEENLRKQLDKQTIVASGAQTATYRHALIIASDSLQQRGALHDARCVQDWLKKVHGMTDKCILTVVDDHPDERLQPTMRNIITAVQWFQQYATEGASLFVYINLNSILPQHECYPSLLVSQDGLEFPTSFFNKELVRDLPNKCRVTILSETELHLELPFTYYNGTWQKGSVFPRLGPADVQVFSRTPAFQQSEYGGQFTNRFLGITSGPKAYSMDYLTLLAQLDVEGQQGCTRDSGGLPKKPAFFFSSQQWNITRRFNLMDVVPNCNPHLGRPRIQDSETFKKGMVYARHGINQVKRLQENLQKK
ncbi:MAG: uncharacterized protein KVP18_003965 [Porospora cf. gigantea A]|uniref:uncharacterized protein n=1 Tax=Porospora cf. gigantea A TaxID=2853593 RepID=UPI00355A16CB|nr:MAG: hypothetical protein KVP18_003965 [Porospora cf. gigantea A]